jgi:hypothetical protein
MSRYVDVSFGAGSVQIELENSRSAFINPGLWWQGPNWRATNARSLPPWVKLENSSFQGHGKYKETPGTSIELFNPDGKRFAYLVLTNGLSGGLAYGLGTGWDVSRGRWNPTDKPVPHSWFGIMAKGGGGLVVGGEFAAAALMSGMNRAKGCSIVSLTGRAGLFGGGSGGLAFVFATGFEQPHDFNNYTADGLDWALSFGPKLSSLVKGGSKLPQALKGLDEMLKTLQSAARVEKLKTVLNADPELGKEVYGIAKGLYSATLIDSDLQSITAVDIPLLGGGAEIGIFYLKSGFKCTSSW